MRMIVTLTMNPAVDKTAVLDLVELGGTNRLEQIRMDAAGKGINVSRALSSQGVPSLAMGLVAGREGQFIIDELESRGIKTKFTWCRKGHTRVNLKVYEQASGRTTELNEPGPEVGAYELEELWRSLEEVLPHTELLICSGSLPPGAAPSFYRELIDYSHERGVQVFFDASGQALLEGVKAKPYFIKPNQEEAELLLGRGISHPREVKVVREQLDQLAVPVIVLSFGAEGAVFCSQGEELLWAKAEAREVESSTGCGDALVAAFAAAWSQGKPWAEVVRWSTATGTAAVELPGTSFPDIDQITELVPRVRLESL